MSLGAPIAERRRELTLGPLGPWATTITVDAVSKNSGRKSTIPQPWIFHVQAEWVGPPAIGFPPSREPVSARDVVIVETLEQAKRLAHRAADLFRIGGDEPPDLRDLLERNSSAFAPREL